MSGTRHPSGKSCFWFIVCTVTNYVSAWCCVHWKWQKWLLESYRNCWTQPPLTVAVGVERGQEGWSLAVLLARGSSPWPWTALSSIQVWLRTFVAYHPLFLSPLVSGHLSTVSSHKMSKESVKMDEVCVCCPGTGRSAEGCGGLPTARC